MFSKRVGFIDQIDSPTERKMKAMSKRARNPGRTTNLKDAIKLIREKRLRGMSEELFP